MVLKAMKKVIRVHRFGYKKITDHRSFIELTDLLVNLICAEMRLGNSLIIQSFADDESPPVLGPVLTLNKLSHDKKNDPPMGPDVQCCSPFKHQTRHTQHK